MARIQPANPTTAQLIGELGTFKRQSDSVRARIASIINTMPQRLAQIFMDRLKEERLRRDQKSAASKTRKEGRLKGGIGLAAGAIGGALAGPALLGGLGAAAGTATVVGGGLATGASAGLSAGGAAALGGVLGGLGGLTAGFGIPDVVPTVGQLGAVNLQQQQLEQVNRFIGGFDFDRSLTGNAASSVSEAGPAPVAAPLGGVPIALPVPNLPTQGPGASPLFPSLQKDTGPRSRALPPAASTDAVSFRTEQLRSLGREKFAAGDMEGAQQLAMLLAELEAA